MSTLLEYRLRIRSADDLSDALVVTSVRGDALPYIVEAPSVDGTEFDPLTGSSRSGSATVRIADAITSGTDRVVTAQLEDATTRQQLAGRKAYVEEREDGGTWTTIQAGIVTGLRLSSAAVWDVDVGDTTMATRNLSAFAPNRDPADFTKIEPLADYLARWPKRGCILGGPIIGGFLTRNDLGGWEMRVRDSHLIPSGYNLPAGGTFKYLEFSAGYGAPSFERTTNLDDLRGLVNDAVGPTGSRWQGATFSADLPGLSVWPDLVVQVGSQFFAAAAYDDFTSNTDRDFLVKNRTATGLFVWDTDNLLTVGAAIVRVRVYDALPSERSPIYYSGHPIDLWTKLCDEAGLAYDATAAAATKAAIGASRRINLRITAPQSWSSFVEGVLYGPCGFSVRTDASGQLIPFVTRIMASDLPSVEITAADVSQDQTVLFELAEPDAVTKVTFEQTNFLNSEKNSPGEPPLDGLIQQSVTVERTAGDSGAAILKEQRYTIPGFLDTGSGSYEPEIVNLISAEIFDRDGRGRLSGELQLLRTGAGADVVLGQEIIVSLPQMPNHNKRLGDDGSIPGRCVQIVRLTNTPRGPQVRFKDSGPNEQPASPLPVIVLAAGPTNNTVVATITNAATLNTAGIAVRLQWAVASSAPALSDYTSVMYFAAGTVPTSAFLLPPVPNGLTAYVRGRAEQGDHRPSAYSTPVSNASVVMGPPTGLSVTVDPTDGSRATVAWTTGSNADAALVDIYIRLSTLAFADAIRMAAGLLPGTISHPLSELIPGDAYIVSVVHRDAVTGATAKTEYTFTAGSTTRTLSPPTNPVGIVGSTDPTTGVGRLDGTYGLNVTAVELPGFVTFWEAVETGIGTGTYGSFTQVSGMVPSVSGGPTSWRGRSANQLLRKQLKARHEAPGTNPSTYTSPVTLDAWGVVVSPPEPAATILPPTAALTLVSQDATTVVLGLSGALGDGDPGPLEYHWRTDGGAWSAYSTGHADQTITRAKKDLKVFQLQTRQSDGQESAIQSFPVTGELPQVDSGTGLVNGLDASGLVTHPVPLPEAVANIPAISSTSGKLIPTVTLDGTAYLPVHTGDAVAALADGATVTNGAARAIAGLDSGGNVGKDVPRAYALAQVPGLEITTGKIDPAQPLYGTSGTPVHTQHAVAVLTDGATVADGADRARNVVDTAYQVWAPAAKPVAVGTPGSPSTLTKTIRVPHTMFVPNHNTLGYSRSPGYLGTNSAIISDHWAPLYVPVGATITDILSHTWLSGTAASKQSLLKLIRLDASAVQTLLATATNNTKSVWVDASASLSEVVSGSDTYILLAELNPGTDATIGAAGILYAEITYTIPDYSKSI